jgi:hypothetical protein
MSEDNMPKTPPQAEIKQPEPAKPEDVGVVNGETVPEMHPVHKTKMTVMIVLTMFLGIVSIVSLVFMIKVRDGERLMFKFPQRNVVVEDPVQESTESMKKPEKKPGEFDPVELVKELDELKIQEIEKSYLDSGLN